MSDMSKFKVGANTYDIKDSTARASKVDKVEGKGLSTNDYSDTEKGKVADNTSAIEAIVNVNGCCNRIPRGKSTSSAGVTFTVNADNSITLTGENNTANSKYFAILLSAEAAEYMFTNFETAKTGVFAWLRDINGNQISNATDTGSGVKVQCPNGVGIYMLEVRSGVSFSTPFTVYPMLYDARLNPTGYVPYAMTNRELTERVERGSVSITTDGVKTWKQMFNSLYALLDMAKITNRALLTIGPDICQLTGNSHPAGLLFMYSGFGASGNDLYVWIKRVRIHSSDSSHFLFLTNTSTASDESNNIPSSGITLTIYY